MGHADSRCYGEVPESGDVTALGVEDDGDDDVDEDLQCDEEPQDNLHSLAGRTDHRCHKDAE